MTKKIKPRGIKEDAKDTVKVAKGIYEKATTVQFDDGGTMKIKGGIKKKGEVLKLEIRYDKKFVDDDVSINVIAGCNNITLKSPEQSSGLYAEFSATKRF